MLKIIYLAIKIGTLNLIECKLFILFVYAQNKNLSIFKRKEFINTVKKVTFEMQGQNLINK